MTYMQMIELVLRSKDLAEDDKLKCIASIIEEEKGKSYNEGFKNGCQCGEEAVERYRFG